MNSLKNNWKKTLDFLKSEVPETSYNTWFADLKLVKSDEITNTLYLECKDSFKINLLQERYIELIRKCVSLSFNKPYNIEILLLEKMPSENLSTFSTTTEFSPEFYFNPRYNFENFVVGKNNEYAHAVSLAVAEAPSQAYNPLFIYGSSGLGKTHLLHAIGNYILQNSSLNVLYVSSEMFTSDLISSLRDSNNKTKLKNFKNKYRNVDVLLIDDIQFLEGKDATQEEFFHTFNHLHDLNKQLIISSDRPPLKLERLDDRLRSRFAWNIVADINPPDYETRVAILTNKFISEGISINEDISSVSNFVAEKIKYNIRELEGAFTRIISFSSLLKRPINLALAKEVLKDIFSASDSFITVESIKRTVCKYFAVSLKDMDSIKRTRNIALPRQIAMYLSRELTDESLPKIGESFGGRDHSTVLHACKKISSDIINDETINQYVSDLLKIINDD